MNQNELNHAVARATMEPVGVIDSLGFSLLVMPPAYPLGITAQRRKYPLRIAPEARKRKRKQPRKRVKSSAKPALVVHNSATHDGNAA
jgi:hypothetical protein